MKNKINNLARIILAILIITILGLYIINLNSKIIIGVDTKYFPMSYKSNNLNILTGFDIELAKAVMKQAKLQYEFKEINWDDKEILLQNGSIDCIWSGLTKTKSRESIYLFTKSYMKNRQVVMINSKSDYEIKQLTDLNDKKIGIYIKSTATYYFYNSNYSELVKSIEEYTDVNKAINDLENNNIQALVIDDVQALYMMSHYNPNLHIINDYLNYELFAVGINKDNLSLKNKIQTAFDRIVENGIFEKLSIKWFGINIYPDQS